MRKKLFLLLATIMCISSITVSAQTFTPQPDMAQEIFIRTTFTDVQPQVKFPSYNRLQVMSALQIMTFSDHQVHLQQYMTEDEVLRILYYVAGVRDQAEQMGEDNAYRAKMGLGQRDASSHSDGLYLYAYQHGLISNAQLNGYFFTYALSRNAVALRYDVYLWMAKLLDIPLDTNTEKLAKFSDGSKIKSVDKPYFAALVNQNLVMEKTSLQLYSPVTREWLLGTLERMEPYFIQKIGYQKREGKIVAASQEENNRKIVVETNDGTQDVIEVPLSETINQMPLDIAVLSAGGRQITACLTTGETIWYYTIGSKVSFIVVKDALPKPLTNEEIQVAGKLYYYDSDMRMVVVQNDTGYIPVFLTETSAMTKNDSAITADNLHQYYGKTIHITAMMRYNKDLLTAKSCRISD